MLHREAEKALTRLEKESQVIMVLFCYSLKDIKGDNMSYKALQNQKVFTGLPTAKAENTLYEKWGGQKFAYYALPC
ncbi:MAG: hypothetical protein PHR27_00625 [Candidatus Cloacimonetes bacterium]|nr:hypothetical protein [Candidatus Cloacimonadota bacterium]